MDAPRGVLYPGGMQTRAGYTLLELTLVLLLIGLLATAAMPQLLHARHVLAVRAARAELVAAIATARSAAILAGGATLVIDVTAGIAWIEAADGGRVGDARYLAASYGVRLEAARGTRVALRFDPLGIGRLANASIRIRRGDALASVTVSAYGRVRS